ncbi:MAG TPA: hypothetical protein VGM20_03690 [Gemmatimonadales bacterium]|jgi:hypothetical protein
MPHITPAHLHVLVNHIPIIGLPIVALLLAWGLARREDAVVRAALLLTILVAIGTWYTDYTGDDAKHDIRNNTWYNRAVVQRHEHAGDNANIAGIAAGVLAIGALILARGGKPVRRSASAAVLIVLIVASGLAGWAGYQGGKIRHDEFGLTPPPTAPPPTTTPP